MLLASWAWLDRDPALRGPDVTLESPEPKGWIIQAGPIVESDAAVRRFHTLDVIVRPWTLSRAVALRFARPEDAQDYIRAHLAGPHSVVAYETAAG